MNCFNALKLSKSVSKISSRSISTNKNNVALILSGCGVYDGSEIIEATSAMIHLSKRNVDVSIFAPNIEQLHVVNHLTGQVQPEVRNVLQEAARIARGNIQSLEKLKAVNFNALVIPGGFGAAKNLCDYAVNGAEMVINKEVERAFNEFILANKPIGLCCISPVIAAKLLPGCELTVGKKGIAEEWPYSGTIDDIVVIGGKSVEKDVNEVQVDLKYRVVTTPAFMKNATYAQVFDGIGKMIDEILKLTH